MGQATNTLRGEDEMVSGQFRKRRHDTPLFIRRPDSLTRMSGGTTARRLPEPTGAPRTDITRRMTDRTRR